MRLINRIGIVKFIIFIALVLLFTKLIITCVNVKLAINNIEPNQEVESVVIYTFFAGFSIALVLALIISLTVFVGIILIIFLAIICIKLIKTRNKKEEMLGQLIL